MAAESRVAAERQHVHTPLNDATTKCNTPVRASTQGQPRASLRSVKQVSSFLIPAGVSLFPLKSLLVPSTNFTSWGGILKGPCRACPPPHLLSSDAELGHVWTCWRPAALGSDVRFNTATQRLRDSEPRPGRERLTGRNLHRHVI